MNPLSSLHHKIHQSSWHIHLHWLSWSNKSAQVAHGLSCFNSWHLHLQVLLSQASFAQPVHFRLIVVNFIHQFFYAYRNMISTTKCLDKFSKCHFGFTVVNDIIPHCLQTMSATSFNLWQFLHHLLIVFASVGNLCLVSQCAFVILPPNQYALFWYGPVIF